MLTGHVICDVKGDRVVILLHKIFCVFKNICPSLPSIRTLVIGEFCTEMEYLCCTDRYGALGL